MKSKSLIILIVVFAVLGGLVVLKQSTKEQPTILDQVKLDPLVPEGVSKDDVAAIELTSGGNVEEKLVLARVSTDPEAWRVPSHFNAPADVEKAGEFVEKIIKLKGELRATVTEDSDLAPYQLGDDMAFRVKGMKEGSKEPLFDVLVGKAPASNQVFMRAADSKAVYMVDVNLRREAGLFSDDMAATPEAESWLKKEVVSIAKDTIAKVTVESPDKRFVIAKETKEVPIEEPEESGETEDAGESEDSGDETADSETAEPATRTETSWVLAEGGAGRDVKQSGIENLAGAFAPLTSTDIVDPEKLAEWGLESPAFRCTIDVEEKDEDVIIEGGRPDPDGDGYVRVASADSSVIFKLPKWTFEKVFPKGRDFVNLPALSVDKETIARIEITQPEGNVSLAKTADGWTISSPTADLEPQTSTLTSIANAVAAWQPADYADSADGKGLDAPERSVTVMTESGESHTIAAGADATGVAGRYARLDEDGTVLVMSKSDIDRVFVAPGELYQHAAIDIDEASIARINVSRAQDGFTLAKEDDAWILTVNGQPSPAKADAADDLASAIADFQIADINFGQADLTSAAETTVQVVLDDGTEHVLRFGAEQDGEYPVAISGKAQTFMAESIDVQELTPSSASLMETPEPALKPAEPDLTPVPGAPTETEPTSDTPGESPVEISMPADETTEAPADAAPETGVVEPSSDASAADAAAETPASDATDSEAPEEPAPAPETSAEPPAGEPVQ
jgi:hypothetical protein